MDELVEVANDFIKVVAPEQPSDRIAETMNERTLRYYITEGLVDRPLGREGTAALYGYRHLLQVLAVKRLQGAYLPIKRIREVLADRSNAELENILQERPEEPVSNLQQAILRRLEVQNLSPGRMAAPSRRRLMLQETGQPYFTERANYLTPPTMEPPCPTESSWERFILGEGVELHVRSDRKGNLRSSEIRRLVERILQSLKDK